MKPAFYFIFLKLQVCGNEEWLAQLGATVLIPAKAPKVLRIIAFAW